MLYKVLNQHYLFVELSQKKDGIISAYISIRIIA